MNIRRRNAFSLVELVIVLVILGVIAAIAIPRMTKGAQGADIKGMRSDLAVLRGAIELYAAEHDAYPTLAQLPNALIKRTDKDGTVNASGAYGPYVAIIPALKTGAKAGQTAFVAPAANPPAAEEASAGWLYDQASGTLWANDTNHFDK
jgi:general secretion pathway protein G